MRHRLPDERKSITHKFSIAGHEGYLTVGLYPDTGLPGEIFITMSKQGSTVSGLMDAFAILFSLCLQNEIPLKVLIDKLKFMRFEPSGWTSQEFCHSAFSIPDYIARYLEHKFLISPKKDVENNEVLFTTKIDIQEAVNNREPDLIDEIIKGEIPKTIEPVTTQEMDETLKHVVNAGKKLSEYKDTEWVPLEKYEGVEWIPLEKQTDDSQHLQHLLEDKNEFPIVTEEKLWKDLNTERTNKELAISSGLQASVASLQSDAPTCQDCGSLMIRKGSCYSCPNCFATSGCS